MLVKFSDLANDYPFIYLTLYKDESKQERTRLLTKSDIIYLLTSYPQYFSRKVFIFLNDCGHLHATLIGGRVSHEGLTFEYTTI